MLCLSRNEGEDTILIIDRGKPTEIRITIRVIERRRGNLRLGFTAPATVEIFRAELLTENEGERKC